MAQLFIDFENFCNLEIGKVGHIKYINDKSFKVLLTSYAIDDGEIVTLEGQEALLNGAKLITLLESVEVEKWAFNASFELHICRLLGIKTPLSSWRCDMTLARVNGFHGKLELIAKYLNLKEQKLSSGKALIKLFCMPQPEPKPKQKPKTAEQLKELWQEFIRYNRSDVETERALHKTITAKPHEVPNWTEWALDQRINATGLPIDIDLVEKLNNLRNDREVKTVELIRDLTGIDNPNSNAQLLNWLHDKGVNAPNVSAKVVESMIQSPECPEGVKRILTLRKESNLTSLAKCDAMIRCYDRGRVRGALSYYGARTGRWSGELIQPQNLKAIRMEDAKLDGLRQAVKSSSRPNANMDELSQLIRTCIAPKDGNVLICADYNSIEARVIAWVAREAWQEEVFQGDGKIYEKAASLMFNVPIESITKDSILRKKGKVATLALGYGGSVGALQEQGGKALGLSDLEMADIVSRWRKTSPNIVRLWGTLERDALAALSIGKKGIFTMKGDALFMLLPSRRNLVYPSPRIVTGKFGRPALSYMAKTQSSYQRVDTFGGKLTENLIQAIARDILSMALLRLDKDLTVPCRRQSPPVRIVGHVHDEIIVEAPSGKVAELVLARMLQIMAEPPEWAKGLVARAEGAIMPYYSK